MSRACPYCGQPIYSAPAELVAVFHGLRLPRAQGRVLATLLDCWPRLVPVERLVEALWPNPWDEPEQARDTLKTYVSKLRRIAEPAGWTICHGGSGVYQFERVRP
jgi:DNA-binding SARP family transcriptional activator